MINSRVLYWGAQFSGWTFYVVLVALFTYVNAPNSFHYSFLIDLSIFLLLAIALTHLMRSFYINWKWLDMKLFPLIPRLVLLSLVCSILLTGITQVISHLFFYDKVQGVHWNVSEVIMDTVSICLLFLFWNAMYFTYHFFRISRNQEIYNLTLEASKNEIELKNLRSQLNPHFLFNSLNGIRALIDIEPKKAKESVTKLSNLLRKSLIMGRENLVTLQDEMHLVSTYLDMEKIRFEERLEIKWNLDYNLNTFMVPPFSIQMLVENAIKHGISTLEAGGEIAISSTKTADAVVVKVENSGSLKTKKDIGIGIENTRRRLDLQFKGMANLSLYQENDKVVSVISFNLTV